MSSNPVWHVLHNIQDRDRYVFRGCVEDVWLSVSSLIQLFPEVAGRIGYLGISFGGGIGTIALASDKRVSKGHVNVPSFGNQLLRLTLPSFGSAGSVQVFAKKHPGVAERTLPWSTRQIPPSISRSPCTAPVHCPTPWSRPPANTRSTIHSPGRKNCSS